MNRVNLFYVRINFSRLKMFYEDYPTHGLTQSYMDGKSNDFYLRAKSKYIPLKLEI